MFKVSKANQYIVKTGVGISDIKLVKKAWVWPGQTYSFFDLTPQNYSLELHAMTAEKLEFLLPAVFTIGPKVEVPALEKYARLLAGVTNKPKAADGTNSHVNDLVKGIIEGETRVIAASMTMEEIFRERKGFKELVVRNVQTELDHFGLFIYNANVKSLQDTQGSEYFSYMKKKTLEGAINQAKIDVAEARFRGDVGEKEKSGLTRQNVSRIDAETIIYENERKAAMSKAQAELLSKQAEYDRQVKVAKIEAEQAANRREADLRKEYEEKRALLEAERLRADLVVKSKIDYETAVQGANAVLYQNQRKADAELFKRQQEAEAVKRQAEADLFKRQQEAEAVFVARSREADAIVKQADAILYQKQKEAAGNLAILKAQAEGIKEIVDAFGSPQTALQYLMIDRGVYSDLASKNAAAIQGLNPKITVWNTGSDTGSAGNPIADIFKSLPPLLTTIQDQTGITPPQWLAQVPAAGVVGAADKAAVVNGPKAK